MSNFPDFSDYGYQIERELGSNRAGGRVTYLATKVITQRKVVIKQFQFARSSSTWSDYDVYDREIQVMRGLNHTGIPRYLDSYQTEDGFCMVQEYKQALSLAEPRSFTPDEVKKIAISVLRILIYLQNRIPPIIHRDIKPANILVDEQINVYLVDFGFARIGEGEVGVSSVVKGTLGFMPPEQLFNRQLTEASDLYGLGMTLICLLTATKADDIGDLVDISYRISFKHLVPKLGMPWVNWLEKMVEPRLKDRYPNAKVALEAIPTYPMRLPEVQFSRSSLTFKARRRGEILVTTITLKNTVPETLLEGQWEVAPHPHDPPHTPHTHQWIAFQPSEFKSNQTEFKIAIDTSKLMADKAYKRQILLHTNSLPKTYPLTIQIETAPIPIAGKNFPYLSLGLLFLFSAIVTWVLAWSIPAETVTQFPAAAGFGISAGAAVGLEAAAWILSTAGAVVGAIASVIAGVTVATIAFAIVWIGAVSAAGSIALAGAGAGLIGGLLVGVATGIVVEDCMHREISQVAAINAALVTTAAAISLGLCLMPGLLSPIVMFVAAVSNLLLAAIVTYAPMQRAQLIANYRRSERNLIKP
ncbi:MAG: serine/threonine protein kinase [Cyanothece sp. SIO1E1]|nr:serine/threonine protein kinase [Cyanothece sp. SIO1E1]